jgi:hypothetical protein
MCGCAGRCGLALHNGGKLLGFWWRFPTCCLRSPAQVADTSLQVRRMTNERETTPIVVDRLAGKKQAKREDGLILQQNGKCCPGAP